ncbi:MAG: GGDEF domain-containing protein [Gammaproteobacteria bacterium]|nr:GGDEF domain-containing protein [Gammaproteobacteria bacterium]
MNRLKRAWNRLMLAPEPAMVTLAGESELLVAKARLLIIALLLVTPTYKLFAYPNVPIFVWGFVITLASAVIALGILLGLKRFGYRPWVGLVTSSLDGTWVTVALVSFMFISHPLTGLNSIVTFEIYFLVIFTTALRYDPRISLFTGSFLTLQYGLLWAFAAWQWNLHAPELQVPGHRYYQWFDQLTRLIFLASATLISLLVVVRVRSLVFRSIRDSLTDCFTRGYFKSHLRTEFARARRKGHSLTVVMVDADHFKRINDEHGHTTGDRALRFLAGMLRKRLRGSDLVARYGGEEFVLLFPEANASEIRPRIEELRHAIETTPFRLDSDGEIHLTVSAGIASYPADASDINKVIEIADQRLLTAKRRGRNRIITGSEF